MEIKDSSIQAEKKIPIKDPKFDSCKLSTPFANTSFAFSNPADVNRKEFALNQDFSTIDKLAHQLSLEQKKVKSEEKIIENCKGMNESLQRSISVELQKNQKLTSISPENKNNSEENEKEKLENELAALEYEIDENYHCLICLEFLKSPVKAPDGMLYHKKCLKKWLSKNSNSSPYSREKINPKELIVSKSIKMEISQKIKVLDKLKKRLIELKNLKTDNTQ